MSRRNVLALALIGAVSLFCWQATQGAKPKDEMLELYGLFVDAVEKVEVNYVRPVRADGRELMAYGRLTKPGRRVAFAEGDVRNLDGLVVATASGSCLIVVPG